MKIGLSCNTCDIDCAAYGFPPLLVMLPFLEVPLVNYLSLHVRLYRHETPQVEITNAHDSGVCDLAWHPIGYILCRYKFLFYNQCYHC